MDRDGHNHHGGYGGGNYENGPRRVPGRRPVTDYGTAMVKWMRNRRPQLKGSIGLEAERPSQSYIVDILPPPARSQAPAETIPAKHIHSSLNKVKHPINVVKWTPEGRRCLTGSSSGEFTLWNGMAFNFETIMQAHDAAIRAAVYSHSEDWLVSADHDGVIKYWQPNFNNVKALQAHNDPIRDLSFAPNDGKFVTASDDASLKIFDFAAGTEESVLTGHGWEAKTVDWHPTKGLLVSGSKDHQVKLWDPRTGRCLTTLHGHKNTISKTVFEPNRGVLLATCARDQTARVFDLRMMRDVCLLRGHEKDVSTIAWHPIHPSLVSTGGADGCINHYLLDEPNTPPGMQATLPPYETPDPSNAPAQTIYPAHKVPYAHDFSIWSLAWHPLGHILASGSNDRVTRFWTRPRPGESMCYSDRYHLGEAGAEAQGTWDRRGGRRAMKEEEEQEMEDEADGLVDQKMPAKMPMLPGLPGLNLTGNAPSDGPVREIPNLPLMPALPGMIPDLPNVPPIPPPMAGMDPQRFAAMMAEGKIVLPLPPPGGHGMIPPPPPNFDPSMMPPMPPNFDPSKLPPDFLANFQPPAGFPPPPPPFMGAVPPPGGSFPSGPPAMPMPLPGVAGGDEAGSGNGAGAGGGIKRGGPLPSQQDSLKAEQKRGKYRHAR